MKNRFDTRTNRLAALAMIAACTQVSGSAFAQGPTATPNEYDAPAVPTRQFQIPAGSLNDALSVYRRATGIDVSVNLSKDKQVGFQTRGLTGSYTDADALQALLEGTGLTAQFIAPQTAVVSIQHADRVDVTASLQEAMPMSKFTQPLLDTPQTVSVVPRFILEDQGATTLKDALRNVPGISLAAGEAGAQGDNLTIRGFTARNDIFLDGIRDFGSYFRDSFNFEAVEALEGPAGIQFGRGSTGGVINQESKVPQAQPFVRIATQFGTDSNKRITADINQQIPNIGHGGTAIRVNLMGQEGGVAGRPFAALRRFGLAPSIEFGMNSKTQFTLSYLHMGENDTPDYGLPWLYNGLAPGVSRNAYFGFADENFLRTNADILTAKVNHDFTRNIALHSIARAANYPRNAQITEPQICTAPSTSVPVGTWVTALPSSSLNSAVACPYVPGSVNPTTIQVNRNQLQIKSVEGDLWEQTEIAAHFRTFGIRHNFVGGVEGGQEISNPIRTNYVISGANTVPSTTLINPNTSAVFGGTGYITSVVHTKVESVGLYFVDTLHLGRLFEASGGIRWDRMDTGYNIYQPVAPPTGGTVTAPVSVSLVESQPTYRAALVFKPNSHGSLYFDYGTSFNPAAESLSLSATLANSSNLKPEQNESFELGAKYSFLNQKLSVEGAIFRTEKDNAREASTQDSTQTINAGNQLVKGIQVSAVGRLPQGMDLVLGYAYLDSRVLLSLISPNAVGFPLANVPTQTFNFFVTHRLPSRFNMGIGGNYVGSRTASSTVPYIPLTYGPATTFAAGTAPCSTTASKCYQVLTVGMKQVPGYWVFNGMLKRPVTDRLEFQANVYNALNRFYIDLPHPSHLIPGAGLSAQVGINFKF